MPAHRMGTVWTAGTGWVKKQEQEAAQYDTLGDGWAFLISFFRWYPDMILDLLRSEDADFELTLIQRMMIRAKARYQYVDITACRGATKSYCSIVEEAEELLLWPGIKCSYYGPSFKQTSKIGSQTYHKIETEYPALARHFRIVADGQDRFEIGTDYGSNFTIAAFRGNTVHKTVAEEYAQENNPPFDVDTYKQVVLPSIRAEYMVRKRRDPTYIRFKQHTITSAGRRQNHAYDTRCEHYRMMARGESALVMDIAYDVILLMGMRPVQWAENLRRELTPEQWAREMESRFTGSDQNPVVRDEVLSEARSLLCMEEHHCCKDLDNKIKPEDVIYVIGYDVSYADGANNAKCAVAVAKLTKQLSWVKRDKYLKQFVWIDDWSPLDATVQARKLKSVWYRYCYEGSKTYIVIDAQAYGSAVAQALMTDLDDGLDPICSIDHSFCPDLELPHAVPIMYPIKAGGANAKDPDSEMVRYAEVQFENRNVELLTSNYNAGVDAYKRAHRMKDDRMDGLIVRPYLKTNELIGQIQNLKKVPSGAGVSEKRISNKIQRDSWSAVKYALRFAQHLERINLARKEKKSAWETEYKKRAAITRVSVNTKIRGGGTRIGGRRF